MMLLDHVSITVADLERAAPFWEAVMTALDAPVVVRAPGRLGFGARNRPGADDHSYLSIVQSSQVPIVGDNRHWAFRAGSCKAVDAFHAAGLATGGTCDGRPGLRGRYHESYYATFVLDPDGNRLEAVCHQPLSDA